MKYRLTHALFWAMSGALSERFDTRRAQIGANVWVEADGPHVVVGRREPDASTSAIPSSSDVTHHHDREPERHGGWRSGPRRSRAGQATGLAPRVTVAVCC